MKENIHFIDCGANIGKGVIWAWKRYGQRLRIIDAFEPEDLNVQILLENMQKLANHLPAQMTVHRRAVWVRNETKKFWIQFWGTRTGSSLLKGKEQIIHRGQSFPEKYLGLSAKQIEEFHKKHPDWFVKKGARLTATETTNISETICKEVECIDLSSWIFENVSKDNYNVLKIDIEGAEYEVIDHLLNTGAHKHIDEWLVEFTPESKVPDDYDKKVVDRFMAMDLNCTDWG